MLANYISIFQQGGLMASLIIIYIMALHPVILSGIMYGVLIPITNKKSIITTCIFFVIIAATVPLFHAWLFVTRHELSNLGWKGFFCVAALNIFLGSLSFEVFTRPALLKAWYGKELYKKMITAPDYTERLERYSHSTAVKLFGKTMFFSMLLIIILVLAGILFHSEFVRKIVLVMMIAILSAYYFHMCVTQHLFKCDCCGRKALHSVHEHPVYKSWVRQLAPIAINNYFRCVFCGIQYALSERTLKKLQRKKMEEAQKKR